MNMRIRPASTCLIVTHFNIPTYDSTKPLAFHHRLSLCGHKEDRFMQMEINTQSIFIVDYAETYRTQKNFVALLSDKGKSFIRYNSVYENQRQEADRKVQRSLADEMLMYQKRGNNETERGQLSLGVRTIISVIDRHSQTIFPISIRWRREMCSSLLN